MSAHIPAGTQAEIVSAVIAERHPKMMLGQIAQRFGVTYDQLRVVIDKAGYPEISKMRAAVAELDRMEHAARVAQTAVDAVAQLQTDSATQAAADPDDVGRLTRVHPDQLHPDPENPRDLPHVDEDSIVELADSMLEVGLLQPIVARRDGDQLVVVAGHRRLIAARRLKWTAVPVIIRGPMPDDQVLAAMLIENGQRKDLDPIEEARGLRKLKTMHDCSDRDVAKLVGRNQVFVSNRLALLALPADEQAAIRRGDMTLVEGTHRGRINSGRVRPTGQDKGWHLGPTHPLALSAKARCQRLGHLKGRKVGGMACGECWESVIRADARQDFVDIAHKTGSCPVCDGPVETADRHLERQAVS